MEKYFKLFELEKYQVLIVRDFEEDEDNEDGRDIIVVTFFMDGIKINQTLGYTTEENRDKAFDLFTDELVQKFVDNVVDMFNSEG